MSVDVLRRSVNSALLVLRVAISSAILRRIVGCLLERGVSAGMDLRHSGRMFLGAIAVAAITLDVILSGCGAASTTLKGRAVATNTPTPLPTAISLATIPVNNRPIPQFPGCDQVTQGSPQPQYVAVGALKVSTPQRLADYPSTLMPSNQPSTPYQIATSAVNNYAPNPPVNPALSSGYIFQICNQTTTAHTLTSMRVHIASFTPRSGALSVWHICQDGPYDAATKQTTGGCGGGLGAVDWLAATLPNNTTGASALAIANPHGGVNLPANISPNMSIQVLIAVDGLASQGVYALKFGVSVDGGAPTMLTPSDGSFLIAPSASVWTGTACQTPAMLAQIPASSQDTYYVCPPAS